MATATLPKTVPAPKVRHTDCFIGGRWVPAVSGKTFETVNPATEEVIAQVAEGDSADVDAAVAAAMRRCSSPLPADSAARWVAIPIPR